MESVCVWGGANLWGLSIPQPSFCASSWVFFQVFPRWTVKGQKVLYCADCKVPWFQIPIWFWTVQTKLHWKSNWALALVNICKRVTSFPFIGIKSGLLCSCLNSFGLYIWYWVQIDYLVILFLWFALIKQPDLQMNLQLHQIRCRCWCLLSKVPWPWLNVYRTEILSSHLVVFASVPVGERVIGQAASQQTPERLP